MNFREKLLAYVIGQKLSKNPKKAKNVCQALLPEESHADVLNRGLEKKCYLEIISYWIYTKKKDDACAVLNEVLIDHGLKNSCVTNDELDKVTPFEDLTDEAPLRKEHREQIYKLITKKCVHQARSIGHFLLPYETVATIFIDESEVDLQLDTIMERIRENHLPTWSCLKALFQYIGRGTFVSEIERDILKLTKDNQPENSTSVCYSMQNSPHGLCVIINNSFKGTGKERNGTMEDEKRLKETFEYLDFTVEIHQDKTAEEMEKIFKSCASLSHVNYDCFVCFILSHGCEGHVFGNDNKKIKITEIRDMFDGKNCDSLVGKPKLFFIQACQGEKVNTKNDFTLSSDGPPNGNNTSNSNASLPNICDFFIFMSSISGTTSWREVEKGSWFIQTLCEILLKNSLQSLNDKIPEINNKLSQMEGFVDRQRVKQMSDVIGNSLRFPIFLKPKII